MSRGNGLFCRSRKCITDTTRTGAKRVKRTPLGPAPRPNIGPMSAQLDQAVYLSQFGQSVPT